MRYLGGFVLAVAMVGSPLRVSAQDTQQGSDEEQEPWRHPHDRRTHSQQVEPDPSLTATPSEVREQEHRIRRARNTLIASSLMFGVGIGLVGGGIAASLTHGSESDPSSGTISADIDPGPGTGLIIAGTFIALPGLIGIAVAAPRFAKRKRRSWDVSQAHYETPRRAHWDLARSRLVF